MIALNPQPLGLFSGYWDLIMPEQRRGNIALPSYHLSSAAFWHLIPPDGSENVLDAGRHLRTIRQLKDHTRGARLDDVLHALLSYEEPRDILRTALIETHFDASVHEVLAKRSSIYVDASEYRRTLLRQAREEDDSAGDTSSEISKPVRDQGFRQAVVEAYDHRCAPSGIRIFTADRHTAVDAAHIKPWNVSQNDDPRNGLALSKLCHWAFEEGLLTLSADYTIQLSPELTASCNTAGHLDTLDGRSPHLPDEDALWPDQEYLSRHRKNRF